MESGGFKIGELLEGQKFMRSTQYNKMECVIVSPLEVRPCQDGNDPYIRFIETYMVKWANGDLCAIRPYNLKRKTPPDETDKWAISKIKDLFHNTPVPI